MRWLLKTTLIDKITLSGKSYQNLSFISFTMKRNIHFYHKANVIHSGGTLTCLTRKKSTHFSCCFFLFTIRSHKGNMRLTFDKSGSHRTLIRLPTAILLLIKRSYFPILISELLTEICTI